MLNIERSGLFVKAFRVHSPKSQKCTGHQSGRHNVRRAAFHRGILRRHRSGMRFFLPIVFYLQFLEADRSFPHGIQKENPH